MSTGKKDKSSNHTHSDGGLKTTEVNMMVELLANEDKLVSDDKRWHFDSQNKADLDDNIDNYIKKKESKDIPKESERAKDDGKDEGRTKTEQPASENGGKSKDDDDESNWSKEELMLKKLDMLRKLSELAQANVKLSQNYNMNSDYKMMKYEYELHKNIRAKQNGINWMSSMALNAIYGLEMLNEKYNPFDLKLSKWSEQMNAEISNYYDVFGELYEKYHQPGKNMAPEVKLLLMFSGSALKFHLTNSYLGNLSGLNNTMEQNPQFAEQMRQQALNTNSGKEHADIAKKVSDLQMLKDRQMEQMNMQNKIASQQTELNKLRQELAMSARSETASMNVSHKAPVNINTGNQEQQTMAIPPLLHKFMQGQNMQNNETHNHNKIIANQQIEMNKKQLEMLETQKRAMEVKIQQEQLLTLEKIKASKEAEEKKKNLNNVKVTKVGPINVGNNKQKEEQVMRTKKIFSDTGSQASKQSQSKVLINKNLDDILAKAKIDQSINNTSDSIDKVNLIGIVDADEVSKTGISLGSKSKDKSNKQIKPKNIGIKLGN